MDKQAAIDYLKGERSCPYCDWNFAIDEVSIEFDGETTIHTKECPSCNIRFLELHDLVGVTAKLDHDPDTTIYSLDDREEG